MIKDQIVELLKDCMTEDNGSDYHAYLDEYHWFGTHEDLMLFAEKLLEKWKCL